MGRFLRSAGIALTGIGQAFRSQLHVRIHVFAAFIVVLAGALLGLTLIEWAVIVLTIGLVIALELVNTAVETVVDLASPEIHPLAKRAKDIAAGAVLVMAAASVVIGLLVLGPHLMDAIGG